MPRKPNYRFERQERERLKAEKKKQRLMEKSDAPDAETDAPASSLDDDTQET